MADARYAVEVAAAGGHHLLLSGPKGSGKTTLAERIPGLLPDLTAEESLELTAIHSLAGAPRPGRRPAGAAAVLRAPPRRQQGQPARRRHRHGCGPGEISRAHCGVLFLDEFPLFARRRHRGAAAAAGERRGHHRARGGGRHVPGARAWWCWPATRARAATTTRIAGADRCTCREVTPARLPPQAAPARSSTGSTSPGTSRPVSRHERATAFARPEPSAAVRARVERRPRAAGRPLRRTRAGGSTATSRARRCCEELAADRRGRSALLDDEVYAGRLSRRGATRVHRLAWTVADLRRVDRPDVDGARRRPAAAHRSPLLALR